MPHRGLLGRFEGQLRVEPDPGEIEDVIVPLVELSLSHLARDERQGHHPGQSQEDGGNAEVRLKSKQCQI